MDADGVKAINKAALFMNIVEVTQSRVGSVTALIEFSKQVGGDKVAELAVKEIAKSADKFVVEMEQLIKQYWDKTRETDKLFTPKDDQK